MIPVSLPWVLGRRLRRKAYHLAYRRRHLRLTSNQQVKSRNLRRFILTLMILSKRKSITLRRKKIIKQLLKVTAINYLNLACYDDEEEKQASNRRRDIDSFTASECRLRFRFHQDCNNTTIFCKSSWWNLTAAGTRKLWRSLCLFSY